MNFPVPSANRLSPTLLVLLLSLVFLLLLPLSPNLTFGKDLERIKIYLKWNHQFQFAGYYAAIEKGFYQEEGLDVELIARTTFEDPVKAVLSGTAEYGVADAGIIVNAVKGQPVVLLTQIFQHSPLVFLTLKESGINTPYDMNGKRVMVDKNMMNRLPFMIMQKKILGPTAQIEYLPHSFRIKDLVENKTDVISAYLTNEPFTLKQLGIHFNIIDPKSYGIDNYGDNLFTSRKEVQQFPDRASRVLRATLRGWDYALKNSQEIIDLILSQYAPDSSQEHLSYQARIIQQLIQNDVIPIGSVDSQRYLIFLKQLSVHGFVEGSEVPKDFFYSSPEMPQIKLSASELTWLRFHPVLRFSVSDNYPPKNYRNKQGELTGISIDYMNLIAERLGIRIAYEGSSWTEALNKGLQHEVDGIINADALEERKKNLSFTQVYRTFPQGMAVRKNSPVVTQLSDFNNRTIAVVERSSQLAVIKKHCPDAIFIEVEKLPEALDLLVTEKVDGVYSDLAVLYHLITHIQLPNLRIGLVNYAPPVGHARIGIRNNAPELLSALNKAISSISKTDRHHIEKQWLPMDIPPTREEQIRKSLLFTAKEKKWLAEHPVITVATDPARAPIEYRDENEQYLGMSADYLNLLAPLLNVRFDFINEPWTELMERGRQGKVDLFSAVAISEERKQFLTFSKPYTTFPVGIFTRDSMHYVSDINELENMKIAVGDTYAVQDWLQADYPDLNIIPVDTTPNALKMLKSGKVDAFIGNMFTIIHYIHKLGYLDLKVAGDTLYHYENRMAAPFDRQILIDILNKAINSLSDEEQNVIYNKWVSIKYVHGVDYIVPWKILSVMALVAFAVICLFVFYNRKLQQEVVKRNKELSMSEERFRSVVEQAGDAVLLTDIKGKIVDVNKQACKILDYNRQELLALHISDVDSLFNDQEDVESFNSSVSSGNPILMVSYHRKKDGTVFPVEIHVCAIDIGEQKLIMETARDISDKKEMAEKLQQSQKMEAIGTLSGGIAHDFNNILSAIYGYIQLAQMHIGDPEEQEESFQGVIEATNRARDLVKQILTFSRKTKQEKCLLQVATLAKEVLKLIRQTLPTSIEIQQSFKCDSKALIDPTQIHQVFMNLCTNAYQAMGDKGTLKISLLDKDFDLPENRPGFSIAPGKYILIQVSDTGPGINKKTLEKIFDPYFTTKKMGEGTGLGLAVVHGIIEDHEGYINVSSEIGVGTTFHVYLPRVDNEITVEETTSSATATLYGQEHILFVDDEKSMADIATMVLNRYGYKVTVFRKSPEALEFFQKNMSDIDIVVTDMTMPKMSGLELAENAMSIKPGIPVILCTGYSKVINRTEALSKGITEYVEKPYIMKDLIKIVRELLTKEHLS